MSYDALFGMDESVAPTKRETYSCSESGEKWETLNYNSFTVTHSKCGDDSARASKPFPTAPFAHIGFRCVVPSGDRSRFSVVGAPIKQPPLSFSSAIDQGHSWSSIIDSRCPGRTEEETATERFLSHSMDAKSEHPGRADVRPDEIAGTNYSYSNVSKGNPLDSLHSAGYCVSVAPEMVKE